MSLIKSISGIRGTIGGKVDENLTPLDVVKFLRVMCVGLFSNVKSFMIFDLYLEILKRKN